MSSRLMKDLTLTVTKVLPAANANNDSSSLDLGAATDAVLQNIEVKISVPALANLVEAKTLTISLQDSADNSSFAAIEELATLIVTGGGGNGAAATSQVYRLPSTCKRYIRFNSAVMNGGGDNTASSITMEVLT
jgi:hypothetical protein